MVSELRAAHRLRRLLRQHDRIARPAAVSDRHEDLRGKRMGTIYGTITFGSGLGAALGSWTGGLLHDWTQSYNALLAFALISVVIGMIPFLVVPALRR